jgi:sugar transferase (PEP-CTERM/EpsH1 system associated)
VANILYLVHRLPYPPNKGDKVRSYHLLAHLAKNHKVFLGTFVDDPEDFRYLEKVRGYCAEVCAVGLSPKRAKLRSLNGLLTGEPLTLPYYRDNKLRRWVADVSQATRMDAAIVFSSAMAQYVDLKARMPVFVDFVDVDSEKWTQYARTHSGPKAWIYRREGARLLTYEREVALCAARSFFVTENERDLFRRLAPECSLRVESMCNGVDAEYFKPDFSMPSPFPAGEQAIVFTGAMDYHPNEDAATWFAREVMPLVRAEHRNTRFYVVGRSPPPAVQALASDSVVVTGTVPDVRPYLQHAGVVVAPLRIARGIQNKILEAMAMAKPVIASAECAGGVDAKSGEELFSAAGALDFVKGIGNILAAPAQAVAMGHAARQCVLAKYSWEAHLAQIDSHLVQPGLRPGGRVGSYRGR